MFRLLLSLFLLVAGVVTSFAAPNTKTSFTAEYTQTSTSTIEWKGDVPEGSSATFSTTYETKEQLKEGHSMTYIISGYDGKTIEAITLSMHSKEDDGTGELFIKIGDRIIAEIFRVGYKGFSGVSFNEWYNVDNFTFSYIDVNVVFKDGVDLKVGSGEDVVIEIKAYKNSLYCQSVSITWNNGSYTRGSLTAEKFGTICLDKGGVVKSGGTLYEIAYRDDSGIYMDEVTRMEAGVPYIFQATDTELVIAHDETTATEPINRNGLYGTFTEISDVAAVSAEKTEYILVNNEISECQLGCKVPANRAYLILDEIPIDEKPIQQGRRRIGMSVQGENQTTRLENTIAPAAEGVYDIMGRKIAEPTASGFYIVNGKKVFVAR